jgi:protein-S-isoprenylcysteine O-methyltransferase Ste14
MRSLMVLDRFESLVGLLGAVAGISTLMIAIGVSVISLRRAPAREEPRGRLLLRAPVTLIASVLFLTVAILGWRPLPIWLSDPLRGIAALLGAVLLPSGVALYLWGLLTLGRMFAPSSGFAARIQADPKLVTSGPYAHVRHPMYLGVILAAVGTLILYRTWSGLVFSILMLGLAVRARREERLLATEFGNAWEGYAAKVPMWLPALRGWRHADD